MIGSRPCAYACAYVDPVFTSQSYDICTSTKTSNLSVFLVLTLMLMSTQFSLAHTRACVTIVFFAAVNHNYDHKERNLETQKHTKRISEIYQAQITNNDLLHPFK